MNPKGGNGQHGHVETDMFDIGGFLRFFWDSVRYHKLLVFSTCVITMAAVVWYHVVWPPIYLAEAQLVAERDLDPSRDEFYANWQVFRKQDPRNEIALFTAGPVLREVIAKNKLKYDDVYHPFLSHAGYLWEKSWLGTKYTELKERLIGASDTPKDAEETGRVMEGLKASISIATEGDSNVANVSVKGPTRRVSDIANSLIESYLAHRKERQTKEAGSAFNVLTAEAERAGLELAAVRDEREAFAQDNGLFLDFQKETQDVRELTGIETNISTQRSKIAALEASLAETNARLLTQPPEQVLASVKEVNNVREAARLRRLELQSTLIALRGKYREDSPEIQEVLGDLSRLEALIAQEPERVDRSVTSGVNTLYQQLMASRLSLMSELEGARSALAESERIERQMRSTLGSLPAKTAKALDLQRDYDLAKEKYQRLLFRRMEAQVSASSAAAVTDSVQVVDYAAPPTGKYWPRAKYLYPGALVVGLALGAIAAILRSLTAGRLLLSQVDGGRIAAPVYATISLGRQAQPLTIVPRKSARVELPPETSPEEDRRSDNSRGAGA